MDTAQWPQERMMKPMEERKSTCNSISTSLERKSSTGISTRPTTKEQVNCPRCNSTNTKFCYYNNYSLTQPRYFCKTCRRYWTAGGTLRNIPVGGGSRKNKRSSSSSSPSSTSSSSKKIIREDLDLNPKIIHHHQDLNLGFSTPQDFKTISELIQVPNFLERKESQQLSALEMITGISSASASRGLNSFFPMPSMNTNTDGGGVYTNGFSQLLPDFKQSLSFSLEGFGNGGGGGGGGYIGNLQEETNGRFLFPFEDLKQVSSTHDDHDHDQDQDQNNAAADDSNVGGYWNGVIGGSGGSW